MRCAGYTSRSAFFLIPFFAFLAACSGAASPLPHSLYYLSGWDADAQVWRLDLETQSTQQVTGEEFGVQDFSVSPADGSLAIVTGNRLYLLDADGGDRRLVADGSTVDPNIEDYIFRGFVNDPVFSPDGATLAYAFDGLHLYDTASTEDKHALTNLGNLNDEPFVFAKEVYSPGRWSPDGSKLLILMDYYEGSTLAVMDPDAEQPFTRLRSEGPVCCTFSWSADSQSVLVANPNYTGDIPGLWSFDAHTGEETVLIPGIAEDGSINFVGWPFKRQDGSLYYFHENVERFSPDEGIHLSMARSAADGGNRTQLRPDVFSFYDALWSPDGSFALVVEPGDEASRLLHVPADGSPLQVLLEGEWIRGLAWGP